MKLTEAEIRRLSARATEIAFDQFRRAQEEIIKDSAFSDLPSEALAQALASAFVVLGSAIIANEKDTHEVVSNTFQLLLSAPYSIS